jgi:hypothetical protein
MTPTEAVLEMLSLYPHPSNTLNDRIWSKCDFYKEIKRALLIQYAKIFQAADIPIKLLTVTAVLCPTMQLKTLLNTLNLSDATNKDLKELMFSNRIFYMAYVSKKSHQEEMSIRDRLKWLKVQGIRNESISKLLIYLVPYIKDHRERKQ